MKRIALALLALLGLTAVASAQGLTTMTVLDSTGTSKTYRMVQDASSRLSQTFALCDPTIGANAATNCVTVTSGALAAGVADGADVAQGAKADAAWVSGSGSVVAILKNIAAGVAGSIPAGTATIGNVINVPTGVSGNALTSTSCGSAVSSCVLKASAGSLYGAYAECTSACWLMVFNSTSAPSNGATTAGNASGNLVECIDVSAGSSKSLTYPIFPRAFSVGITVAISSTACATLTLSTVGFVSGGVL